jgi:hypothetical protein
MVSVAIETVNCSHCGCETQLFARLYDERTEMDGWSAELCSQCFELAKKNEGKRCACCNGELLLQQQQEK